MSSSSRSQRIYHHSADPRDEEGIVRCYEHCKFAVKYTSQTSKNPGREFYCCPVKDKDDNKCKFFMWADDPILQQRPRNPASITSVSPQIAHLRPPPGTPGRLSQRDRAPSARTPSIQASPAKRPRSISPSPLQGPSMFSQGRLANTPSGPSRTQTAATPSSAFTPSQKQRRIDAIRAALQSTQGGSGGNPVSSRIADIQAALGTSPGVPGPSSLGFREAHIMTGSTAACGQGQENYESLDSERPPSPKRNRTEDEDMSSEPPSPQASLHSAGIQTSPVVQNVEEYPMDEDDFAVEEVLRPPSRASTSVNGDFETVPSSPYQLPGAFPLPRSPRTPSPSGHPHGFSASQSNGLLTPPQSTELGMEFSEPYSQSSQFPPESPTRRKGKGRADDSLPSQWQQIQAGPDNPFHDRAAAFHEQSPGGRRLQALFPPQTQDHASAGQLTPDSIAAHLAELAKLPDYVRKLQRKQMSAQKSIEVKSRRIAELEQEIECLRGKNRALETAVEALRARR